ncbi:hypothetical protein DSECCO2_428910 [anaerobic digester metagenome]
MIDGIITAAYNGVGEIGNNLDKSILKCIVPKKYNTIQTTNDKIESFRTLKGFTRL